MSTKHPTIAPPRLARSSSNRPNCQKRLDPNALRDAVEAARLTVFYHGGCPDGVTGAWAIYWALPAAVRHALKAFGGVYTDGRTTVGALGALGALEQLRAGGPVFCGIGLTDPAPAPVLVRDRHVVYVDIVPGKPTVLEIVAAESRTLTILDHHRSAKALIGRMEATGQASVTYTEELSGAQIAWDWAHPESGRPQVVDFVGARDRWDFRLEGSRAGSKALYTEGLVQGFEPLSARMEQAEGRVPPSLVARGDLYLLYEDDCVARLVAKARTATIKAFFPGEEGPREYCVRVVNTPILQSEVGDRIMENAPPEVHFAVMWSYLHDRDEVWASARTNRPDVDLSKIAPCVEGGLGGGGHPKAAGFSYKGFTPKLAFVPLANTG